jgi:hypothetical protein
MPPSATGHRGNARPGTLFGVYGTSNNLTRVELYANGTGWIWSRDRQRKFEWNTSKKIKSQKPIVLRMVYQMAKQVKIPIIGIGSVTKAEDVVEYMLAGASAVGIGYAGFRNPTALVQIIDDLEAWCEERGVKKVTELIGAVKDADMEINTLVAAASGI